MTAIRVRFLHGWLRAAGRGDGALMGTMGLDAGEWPPSPARLYAALVAGGGSGAHRRAPGDDSELRAIERAAPPRIVADPEREVARSHLADRFVVVDKSDSGNVQNYPGRKAAISRPGVRLAPRHPQVVYCWPELGLAPEQERALAWRAARVGYLGAADAPAQVAVVPDPDDSLPTWVPAPDGTAAVTVPFPGSLDALDSVYEAFLGGTSLPASTLRRQVVHYRSPDAPARAERQPEPALIWMRFDRAYSGHRILAVSEAVKGLVLSAFGSPGLVDEAPGILTGHGLAPGAERARYWPLPHAGARGDGRLFGACVCLPADCPAELTQRISARFDGATLHVSGASPRRLSLFGEEPGPWAANPSRWRQTARRWVSVSPVVLVRHPKGDPTPSDVGRMCDDAGLPPPIAYEFCRVPLIQGGIDLRPHQTTRKGERPRPYGHLRLEFAAAVTGPFALGAMRSYGLGLMAPDPSASEAES